MAIVLKQHSILPGFGLAMGFTLLYLTLIVLIPLSAAFVKTDTLSWDQFWDKVTDRALASYPFQKYCNVSHFHSCSYSCSCFCSAFSRLIE